MENLIFSLNATIPVFTMMILGYLFHKLGWISDELASGMNKFVFLVPLPVLVFEDLATVDFSEVWDVGFVLFCFFATLLSIGISCVIASFWKDKSIRGEFIQASYRSSAALLGIAFIQNIYGNAGMGPLMIIGSVPLYNVMAVLVLEVFRPGNPGLDRVVLKRAMTGIAKNPIIISIVLGLLWSALGIPMPQIPAKVLSSIGGIATPMGLMAMGAGFHFEEAIHKLGPTVTAAFMKLVGFELIFLPAAACLGFRQEELVAILIMLGSATTVSAFVMAKNMGHEGTLTSGAVMLTTLFSAFTLTFWLFLLRSLGLV